MISAAVTQRPNRSGRLRSKPTRCTEFRTQRRAPAVALSIAPKRWIPRRRRLRQDTPTERVSLSVSVSEPTFTYDQGMASIGYARVSTKEQSADSQLDALAAAGVSRTFVEKCSGVLANRPQLDALFENVLRPGDILVITKLDRLGRSVKDLTALSTRLNSMSVGLRVLSQGIDTTTPGGRLFFHMLAAVAEFEHDLIVERTKEGLEAARSRGRTGGRKPGMSPTQINQARAMIEAGTYTKQQIAETFNVSRATLYRNLGNAS